MALFVGVLISPVQDEVTRLKIHWLKWQVTIFQDIVPVWCSRYRNQWSDWGASWQGHKHFSLIQKLLLLSGLFTWEQLPALCLMSTLPLWSSTKQLTLISFLAEIHWNQQRQQAQRKLQNISRYNWALMGKKNGIMSFKRITIKPHLEICCLSDAGFNPPIKASTYRYIDDHSSYF